MTPEQNPEDARWPMPRHDSDEDEWDEEDSGWEGDSASADADWEEPSSYQEDTIPCPYCHREIHHDSVCCPYCEQYLSREDEPPARKPWWLIGGVLVCLVIVYWWIRG
jgi:hypothetical protein